VRLLVHSPLQRISGRSLTGTTLNLLQRDTSSKDHKLCITRPKSVGYASTRLYEGTNLLGVLSKAWERTRRNLFS
jgi:hypothetical protein